MLPAGTAQLLWFTTLAGAPPRPRSRSPLGLPLAWAIGRFSFRGRALVRALVLVPFVLPTVVVATAFLGAAPGAVTSAGIWAILAAHVFFNVAVVTRIVGGAWATARPAQRRGGGRARSRAACARIREVTLPQLAPALSAAAALTFLFCFTSFGVILILGGPGRATLETEIYNQAARLFDLQAAAALSLLQLGAVAVVLAVASILEARAGRAGTLTAERDVLRRPAGRERRRPRRACSTLAALVLVLPLAVLVARARSGAGARSSRRPRRCSSSPWQAAVYSVAFATVAAADRARRRRPRGARARAPAAGRRSTASSCSRSAPRP